MKSTKQSLRQILRPLRKHAQTGKNSFRSEHDEQVDFVNWFRETHPDVMIFSIPNGGVRSKRQGAILKEEGLLPGVPDLFIPAWKLWIEMKRRKGGVVSAAQKEVMAHLDSCGYVTKVAHGFEEAKRHVESFRSS